MHEPFGIVVISKILAVIKGHAILPKTKADVGNQVSVFWGVLDLLWIPFDGSVIAPCCYLLLR